MLSMCPIKMQGFVTTVKRKEWILGKKKNKQSLTHKIFENFSFNGIVLSIEELGEGSCPHPR
jgi:hypothetical protein